MALHEQAVGATSEWYTPPHVFEALGCTFDIDVAAAPLGTTPWIPARRFIHADSLDKPWSDFIWMNAPFGERMGLLPWLRKFIKHRNGIALVPDRTSCPWWQEIAPQADAVLFTTGKLKFIPGNNQKNGSPAQGTCLFGIGNKAIKALMRAEVHELGILLWPKRC